MLLVVFPPQIIDGYSVVVVVVVFCVFPPSSNVPTRIHSYSNPLKSKQETCSTRYCYCNILEITLLNQPSSYSEIEQQDEDSLCDLLYD